MLLTVVKRRDFGFENFTPAIAKEQQAIADSFYKLKLIPKQIKVSDVVWQAPKK